MVQKILIVVVLFLSVNVHPILANSQANLELPRVLVPPGNLYYSVVRGWEKISYYFNFTKQSKINFNRNLLRYKVAELKNVSDEQKLGEIEKSTNRVSYYSGTLVDSIIDKYKNDTDKNEMLKTREEIKGEFRSYIELMNGLRDKFPANTSFWLLVQHSINSMEANIRRLEDEIR